jgi:peptidoglycan L-alanyl-D-glutamate endopeptidase CwlK
MISSRDLKDLHPKVKKMAEAFIAKCKAQGIDVLITSTFRDNESQTALYNQGRTAPGNRVTNARAGQSFHNYRVAFDFAPIKGGKIDWADTATFNKCGAIAKSVGLDWAGDWTGSMRELAHCQLRGVTIAQLLAGVV